MEKIILFLGIISMAFAISEGTYVCLKFIDKFYYLIFSIITRQFNFHVIFKQKWVSKMLPHQKILFLKTQVCNCTSSNNSLFRIFQSHISEPLMDLLGTQYNFYVIFKQNWIFKILPHQKILFLKTEVFFALYSLFRIFTPT